MQLAKINQEFRRFRFIAFLGYLLAHVAMPHGAFGADIDNLLTLPEKRIDIGIAALTFAKEVYPDIDIKAYSAKLDEMVRKAKVLAKGSTDPDYRIRALNTYLYKVEGFGYDKADPNAEKLQNRYLNGILDTKKGSCVTLPLLYLAIAQRLGYPVYPVSVPQHFFLRYVDTQLKNQNIEASGGGGYVPDDEYIEVLQVSKKALKNGAYLRTLTYREYLADLLSEEAIYWAIQKKYKKAIHYLELSVKINPKSPEIHSTLGKVYANYSKLLEEESEEGRAEQYRLKAETCFEKADNLGIVKLSKNYMEEQKKAQEKFRRKKKG